MCEPYVLQICSIIYIFPRFLHVVFSIFVSLKNMGKMYLFAAQKRTHVQLSGKILKKLESRWVIRSSATTFFFKYILFDVISNLVASENDWKAHEENHKNVDSQICFRKQLTLTLITCCALAFSMTFKTKCVQTSGKINGCNS